VHVAVDNENKLTREYEVTSAEAHDSKVFIELLTENSSADVWADSAYQSGASSVELYASSYRNNVHKKGRRNKPLSVKQQEINTKKSKTRVPVEHVFGSMENEQGGMFIRTIGQVRSTAKIGLMNSPKCMIQGDLGAFIGPESIGFSRSELYFGIQSLHYAA